MDICKLENEKYKGVHLIRACDTKWTNSYFFIRKYSSPTTLHRHEYMQINYILEGKGMHYINNNSFGITKGNIFVIPPYIPHYITFEPEDGLEIIEFEFELEFINEAFNIMENADSIFDFAYIEPFLVSETQIKPRLNLVGKAQVEVESLLNEALKEYAEKKAGYELIAKSLLLKLLVITGRHFSRELEKSPDQSVFKQYRDDISKAFEYVKNNYSSDINLNNIAKKYFFSPSYFSYLFKTISGKTFTNYVNDLRIAMAMELLYSTNKKVIDISNETGFNNVTHFNRIFKKKTGMSPLAYRSTRDS
jgi:AraC-like DNA-binding protein/mannose-6-phosphate isomerase-like protein (cupin superfamily)